MNFLGIGPLELIIVALVAFIFLGPARMMEGARSLGKVLREIRHTTSDLPSLLSLDEPLDQPPKHEARSRAKELPSDPTEGAANGR